MKNVRIKVSESCNGKWFNLVIYEGRKKLMSSYKYWCRKSAAIRNAKAIAKTIRIKYDPEIIKRHGC